MLGYAVDSFFFFSWYNAWYWSFIYQNLTCDTQAPLKNPAFRVLLEAQWWGPKGEGRRCGRKGNAYTDNLPILALIACAVSDHASCLSGWLIMIIGGVRPSWTKKRINSRLLRNLLQITVWIFIFIFFGCASNVLSQVGLLYGVADWILQQMSYLLGDYLGWAEGGALVRPHDYHSYTLC